MIKAGKKSQWYGLALAIAPALVVFGLVYAADVYYNLDTSRIVFNETATTTFAGSIAQPSGNLIIGSATGNLLLNPYGGKVGIASSTPSDTFAVQGNIIGSGNLTVYGASTSTFAHGLIVDTSTLYVVANTNNIGIGTTTPTARLDIVDRAGNPQLTPVVFINRPNNLSAGDQTPSNAELRIKGHSANYKFYVEDHTANSLFAITGSGGVGIATSSPRYKLDVWSDFSVGTSTDTNTPALYVDSGDGGRIGIGTTTLSTNLFTVGTTTPVLIVDNINQVGIGTSTPSSKFAVQGNIIGSGNLVVYGTTVTSTFSGGLSVGNNAALVVNQAASANSLYIATNGNVGIGTAGPYYRFHTKGTSSGAAQTVAFFGISDAEETGLFIQPDGTANQELVRLIAAGYAAQATDLVLSASLSSGVNEDIMTLKSGGSTAGAYKVGIATSTPRYKLDVWGDLSIGTSTDTNTPALYVDSGNGGRVGIGTTTLAGLFTVGTTTPRFVVSPVGYVGIASSTPSETFAVQGNMLGMGNIVISGTINTGQGATEVYSMDQAVQTTNNVTFATVDTGQGANELYAMNQNVRTSDSPTFANLTLTYGISSATGTYTGLITATGGIISQASSTFTADLTVDNDLFVDVSENKVGIASSTPSDTLAVQGNIIGSGNLVIYGTATSTIKHGLVVDTSTLYVVADANKVGIGTANPQRKLDISGTSAALGSPQLAITGSGLNAYMTLGFGYLLEGNTNVPAEIGFQNMSDGGGTKGDLLFATRDSTTGSVAPTERMRITSAGLVGIATTTPRYTLDVYGDFAVGTTTGTGAHYPLLFVDSGAGGTANGVGIGTTTVSGTMLTVGTTTPAFVVSQNGNVGVATTVPSMVFAVQGQCVTGDTRLRRRRKKKSIGSTYGHSYAYDEVMIKDVQPGDEIASLDEKTGNIVWSKVNALLDMGVKEIYKLITSKGKTIRTTGNHPYLVREMLAKEQSKQTSTKFEVDQSNRIEEFNRDTFLAIANQELAYTIKLPVKEKQILYKQYREKHLYNKFIGWQIFVKTLIWTIKSSGFKITDLVIDFEYPGYEQAISGLIKQYLPGVDVSFKSIGKHSPAHSAAYLTNKKEKPVQTVLTSMQIKKTETPNRAEELLHRGVVTADSQSIRSNNNIIANQESLSSGNGRWTKVFQLRQGQEIAVADGDAAVWEKIVKIEILPAEQVYDIEVEGTHNFIGNDIVAHNTYMSATTTIASGLNVNAGQLYVQTGSGNVGIGTAAPTVKLDVVGNVDIDGDIEFQGTQTLKTTTGNLNIYSASGDDVLIGDGSGILFVDGGNNNVGIGAAPTIEALLDLSKQDTSASSELYSLISRGFTQTLTGNPANYRYNQFLAPTLTAASAQTVTNAATLYIDASPIAAGSAAITNTYALWVDAGTSRFDGNVGIATTTPRYALDVYGDFAVGTTTGTGAHYPLLFVDSGAGGTANGVGIGTTTVSGTMLTVGTTTPAFVVSQNGNVGIGMAGPSQLLHVKDSASSAIARQLQISSNSKDTYFGVYGTDAATLAGIAMAGGTSIQLTDANVPFMIYQPTGTGKMYFAPNATVAMTIDNAGNVGIGTTTPGNVLTINSAASKALTVTAEGNLGIGMATTSTRLTMASAGRRGDFAIGDFNAEIIDEMEDITDWSSWSAANVAVVAETSIVKVGSGSLQVYASSTPEDMVAVKTYSSNQDWSAFERLGFWVYADRFATSSATTTQLLSVGIHGNTDNVTSTKQIYFQSENKWQYEEWNIDTVLGVTTTDRIFFRVDFNNLGTINFYIDQLRLYDDTERTGEIFVDADGVLAVLGRGGVEIGRADGSGNKPGVKVDSAIVEINQPLSVDVGGDVGFDYDLQFLSTGLSQITSEGPLRIAGGDPNHGENLTLTVGGTGDIIVELANASSSMIITQIAWATTTAFIINSEQSVTTTASNLGKLFEIISDYGSDENTVFAVDAGGSIKYDMTASTPAADVAENYYVQDQTINSGDVVCMTESTSLTVEKCSRSYQSKLIGVISSRPALLMGDDLESSRPVALAGRVPVKVSSENGSIAIGDPLTSASSTPGVAMKATRAGKIFGYALEAYGDGEVEPPAGGSTSTDSTAAAGVILAFMHLDELGGDLTVSQNETGNLVVLTYTQSGQQQFFSIDGTGALVVGKIKTQELCVGSVCVTEVDFLRVFGAGLISTTTESGEVEPPAGDSTSTDSVATTIPNGANRPCSSDVGACQIGVQIYTDGVWGECMGAVFPTDEILDEVDNNCDGTVDEGLVGGDQVSTTSTEPIIETATSTAP